MGEFVIGEDFRTTSTAMSRFWNEKDTRPSQKSRVTTSQVNALLAVVEMLSVLPTERYTAGFLAMLFQ